MTGRTVTLAVILLSRSGMRLTTAFLPLSFLAVAACSDDLDGPGDHVIAKTTQLVQYNSCSELETDLKQMVTYEIWADIDRMGYWGRGGEDTAGEAGDSGAGAGSGGGREEGVDYSGTNNQENGVDEADF